MFDINKIYNGNCLDVLKECPDNYFDSVVTDPPYGLSFMGKHWDYDVPKVEIWKEIIRVLKPGGHLLCACGTRTQHRMAVNIEDAGFEIRDIISWIYGSGFPKSLNVGKAIDQLQGNEREVTGTTTSGKILRSNGQNERPYQQGKDRIETDITKGNSEYEGWGTALKPAQELWTLARKPLSENTVAENVLKYGTGGINIDGSRIETEEELNYGTGTKSNVGFKTSPQNNERPVYDGKGRFPANVIFDEFTGKILDEQTGILTSGHMDTVSQGKNYGIYGKYNGKEVYAEGDSGGASRFFYCPKADNYERNKGLKDFDLKKPEHDFGTKLGEPRSERVHTPKRNHHPTVKPIDLMRYLVRLITPKGGIVLDPFNGSGTTGIAAKLELMKYVGIEMDEEYCKISEARIAAWNPDKYKPQQLF